MGVLDDTRFVERLQFFNGQRLFAADLQDIEAFNREMRWLHNRSLHQPGIGSGFAVYAKKGDRTVTIGPGYVIDSLGREIVLTETPEPLPIPPVAGENDGRSVFYDLAVSYPDDDDLEEAEFREGVCDTRGAVRLREEPVLCWVRLQRDDHGNLEVTSSTLQKRILDGLAIVLARAEVLNCQLENDISLAQRRNARPSRQPQVACGIESPEWVFPTESDVTFDDEDGEPVTRIALTAEIRTDRAGFVATPCYSARISGDRVVSAGSALTQDEIVVLLDAIVTILPGAGPKGFSIRALLIAQRISGASSVTINQALISHWKVEWIGVEG